MFYGRVQATAVRDDTGSLSYFLGVFEDVTAEIEATSALKASEARLRAIIDNSPDIIAVLYPNGHWEASKQSTRLLGYPKDHVIEGGLYSLVHPDDATGRGGRAQRSAGRHAQPEGADRAPPPRAATTRTGPSSASVRTSAPTMWTAVSWSRHATSPSASAPNVRAPRGRRAVPHRVRALAALRLPRRPRRSHPRHQRRGRRAHAELARSVDRHGRPQLRASRRHRPRDRGDVATDLRDRRARGVPHGPARRKRSLGDVARGALHARRRPRPVRHLAADRHHRAAQPRGTAREGSDDRPAHGPVEPQRVHEPRAARVDPRTARPRSGCCSSTSTGSRP